MSEGEEYIIDLPLILWAGFDKFDKWSKLGRVLNKKCAKCTVSES